MTCTHWQRCDQNDRRQRQLGHHVADSHGDESPSILVAGFQEHIVAGVDIGAFLPVGYMLHVHIWAPSRHCFGDTNRDVRIQEQASSHTRKKE